MEYKVKKYPDGSSYVQSYGIYGQINRFEEKTIKINSYEDLWHLNQTIDASPNFITVTIPNLIDAQADRRFEKFQSSGLKLVCKFLNSLNAKFRIFHPHNPEVVEALIDDVEIIDNSEFIDRVLNKLTKDHWKKGLIGEMYNLTLMSSDAGGFKPLMKLVNKLKWPGETYSASKSRQYVDGESKLTQVIDRQDFEGKDVLIIDDICVYGGTFKGLAKLLRERNVGKLYLAVSHITVQSHKGKDPVFNHFDKVFTTNSKFDHYWIEGRDGSPKEPKNLEIINLF